ncbi:RICIN domain-containing protein [Streptomyces sp. NBC_00885]|uniref:RICIN domain-containing protein n=1 Tax=Streptomyces sp. NBC_00885 TaxID=2975857 RepID=UPI0038640236|nr:RICIN domain-containing protein [Streptomyces sp. NBC_00885]
MSEEQATGESASPARGQSASPAPAAARPSGETSVPQVSSAEVAANPQAGEEASRTSSSPDPVSAALPVVSGEALPTGATTSATPEPRAVAHKGDPSGAAAAAPAVAGGGPPDEPGPAGASGGPKRPVLAGAAIAGAVLVAIPLLLMGSASDDEKKTAAVANAAGTDLDDEGPDRAGAFVPERSQPPSKPAKAAQPEKKARGEATAEGTRSSGTAARERHRATPRRKPVRRAVSGPDLSRILIKNWKNQTCVDIPAFGNGVQDGPVNQSTCNSTAEDNQLWNLEAARDGAGPGGTKLYVIRNVKDGNCLDLPNYGSAGVTTRITEYACNHTTADNQLWWLQERANNTFWIRNHASSDLCLDVDGSNDRRRDVPLTLFYCSDTDDQNWLFTSR